MPPPIGGGFKTFCLRRGRDCLRRSLNWGDRQNKTNAGAIAPWHFAFVRFTGQARYTPKCKMPRQMAGAFCFVLRRGRDSNPRYKFKLVQRFSKPALSATQAPLLFL